MKFTEALANSFEYNIEKKQSNSKKKRKNKDASYPVEFKLNPRGFGEFYTFKVK